jgi:hypothetical protein
VDLAWALALGTLACFFSFFLSHSMRRCAEFTFALQTVKRTPPPAQLRTSCAKRCGSGLSCYCCQSAWGREDGSKEVGRAYNLTAIDPDDEVVPWIEWDVTVGVAQNLKAASTLIGAGG